MKDNPRVLNTLCVIARQIFDLELNEKSLKGMTQVGQTESPFRYLFIIIMESQSQNKNFNTAIIRNMCHRMRDYCKVTVTDPKKLGELNSEKIKQIMMESMLDILDNFKQFATRTAFTNLNLLESQSLSL